MAAARITSSTLMARPPVTDLAGCSSTTSLANQSCSVAQLFPSRNHKHKPHQSACLSQNQSPSFLSSSERSFLEKLQYTSFIHHSSLHHPRNAALSSCLSSSFHHPRNSLLHHPENSHLNDPRNSLLHHPENSHLNDPRNSHLDHPENSHLNDPRNSHLDHQLELHPRAQHLLQYVCRLLYSILVHPDFLPLRRHFWSLLQITVVLLLLFNHAKEACSSLFPFIKWPDYDAQHPGSVKCSAADNSNGRTTQSKPSEMVVCFGEMLIDFVPTVGGLSLADAPAFKKAPGGAPANVAVGIARLGGNSAFMGKVGDDEFGYMLVDILKENRVESRGVRFDPGARTALAFVTLREDGEREFMFYRNPSADMLLDIPELDVELIQQATILHYGSISLIAEPCRSAHLKAMEIARNAGVLLSYDPNLRLPLWPSAEAAREGIKSIWDEADIIKISEEEITFLTEGGDPYSDEAAMSLWHPNLKLLLVTEGADGCRYYTKKHSGRVDGLSVTPVDTTGAGDAFVGGLLTAIVRDLNLYEDEAKLREALKFANACGAIATTERGAIPALPDRDTVMRLISNVTV